MFLRRCNSFTSLGNSHFIWRVRSFSLTASRVQDDGGEVTQFSANDKRASASANLDNSFHLSPLLSSSVAHVKDYKIELVDDETWRASRGLADAWRCSNQASEANVFRDKLVDEVGKYVPPNKEDPDFDEIEDMRIRGNLFYKLDRDSKEFEEYSFEFHRRKSSKNKSNQNESKKKEHPSQNSASGGDKSSKNRGERKERNKKDNVIGFGEERHLKIDKNQLTYLLNDIDSSCAGNKLRTPTFNQLTAPYHEPFCLDIYISNASVRACIIHRATSNVVAVAHSISKDMKFDLGSTRNAAACAAVGEVLAQRALADDIHNVVYTPRKGERLEGKLQIVLKSIIKGGVDVKVKIKQRKLKKAGLPPAA